MVKVLAVKGLLSRSPLWVWAKPKVFRLGAKPKVFRFGAEPRGLYIGCTPFFASAWSASNPYFFALRYSKNFFDTSGNSA